MTTDNPRAEALRKLAELGVKADPSAVASAEDVKVERTGEEVYAGGDVARVLISPAHLTYRDERNELLHAFAVVGDTVLLTEKQAKRLDGLMVTEKPGAKKAAKKTAAATPPPAGKTDEELEAMTAAELVAHVNQNGEDKVRVRALEGKRTDPRRTVLKATAPEGADDEDDEDEELDA
jgi:hypothetical protein